MYAVITCDLKGSKRLSASQRWSAQELIRQSVPFLGSRFSSMVADAFEFRFGDEWQILVADVGQVFTIYSTLYYFMMDVPFHCGIGIGEIDQPRSTDSHSLNGTAFHLARAALEQSKHDSKPVVLRLKTTDSASAVQVTVQRIIDLINFIRSRRRGTQLEATKMAFLEELGPEELGRRIRIHRTAALRRLQSAGFVQEIEGVHAVDELIAQFGPDSRRERG